MLRKINRYLNELYKKKFFFFKIQAFIMAVVVVPVVLLGYFSYHNAQTVLIREYREKNIETLKQVGVSMDLLLENIYDISKQVYNDSTLGKIMNQYTLSRYDDMNYLYQKVEQVKFSNKHIQSVVLYLERPGKIISSELGFGSPSQYEDPDFYEWYESEDNNIVLWATHRVGGSGTYTKHDRNVISVFTRLPIDTKYNSKGALVINISQKAVYEMLATSFQGGTNDFLVVDTKGNIIITGNEAELYRHVEGIKELKGIQDQRDYLISYDADGKPLLINKIRSTKADWSYISVYPLDEAYIPVNDIKRISLISSLLLTLLSTLVSVFFISREFKPLDEIIDMVESRTKAAGRKKGLNYLKDAVSWVITNTQEMEDKLETAMPLFKQKFVYDLIVGGRYDLNEIKHLMGTFSLNLPMDHLIVAVMEIDAYEEKVSQLDYYGHIVKFSALDHISKYFQFKEQPFLCQETDADRFVFVLHSGHGSFEEMLEMIKEIQHSVNSTFKICTTIGVYDTELHITELKEGYQKAVEAARFKLVYGSKKVILYSQLAREEFDHVKYPREQAELLKTYIKTGNKEKAFQMLDAILDLISANRSYLYIQWCVTQLFISITEGMEGANLKSENGYAQDSWLSKIVNAKDMDEIRKVLYGMTRSIIEKNELNKDLRIDQYYKKIITYIQRNYMRELSVEQVCRDIGLSPTYVYYIIKKYTGKTFTQYLNEYRVEKACEMLVNGKCKIKNIASEVGYSTDRYFIKIFKEIKGVTPGDYAAGYSKSAIT